MTIETKTTIELQDVNAIEFECKECGSKITLSFDKFKQPPTRCSVCERGNQWLIPGDRNFADLMTLGRVIQWFHGQEKPQRFTLRLCLASSDDRASNDRA